MTSRDTYVTASWWRNTAFDVKLLKIMILNDRCIFIVFRMNRLVNIFQEGLTAICPRTLMSNTAASGKLLKQINNVDNLHVIGFGKAASGMTAGLLNQLDTIKTPEKVTLVIPHGSRATMIANQREDLIPKSSKYEIEIIEAAKNNLPDDQSAAGASKILEICQNLGSEDGLLVCCSGTNFAVRLTQSTVHENLVETSLTPTESIFLN